MSQTSPYKTLSDIYSAIIQDAKEATSAKMVSMVTRWINEGYEKLAMRKKRKWLDQTYTVQLNPYTNADCSVASGSATVTFIASTTFPSDIELKFYVPGFQEVYNVSSATTNVVTLDVPYLGTTATAASGIVYQASIIMPDTVRDIYQAYHQYDDQPLTAIGPQQMRALQEGSGQQFGPARFYTIFGDSSNSRRVILYPNPSTAYTIYFDANFNTQSLVATTDEPLVPIKFRQILYWYGIYKLWLFHRNSDQAATALANFNQTLIEMDGEISPTLDYPQLVVAYPRANSLRRFAPGFDPSESDPSPFA